MSTILILDYDGTITTADTISTLATSALAFKNQPIASWEALVNTYLADYNTYVSQSKPAAERITLEDEIEFLRGLRAVEIASFARVSTSKVFAGISPREWQVLGAQAVVDERVIVRAGFERLKAEKMKWGILSVNFSSEWIQGASGVGEGVKITANSIDEEGLIRGPDVCKGEVMATSDGKLEELKKMIRRLKGSREGKVVYVGDSGTDLECLIEEGIVGVVMSGDGEGSLMETLRRVEVEVRHLKNYEELFVGLYWIKDFNELLQSPLLK